jgi:WD40 repeat protein
MRKFKIEDSLKILASRKGRRLTACVAIFLIAPLVQSCSSESVHSELALLQRNRGYRLVAVRENKIFSVSFADRTITESKPLVDVGAVIGGTVSPDGKMVASMLCATQVSALPGCGPSFLAILQSDGSVLRRYPDFTDAGEICWSHDMSKLVLPMTDRRKGQPGLFVFGLQILDLKSGQTEVILEGGDAFASSQCWSPDDRKIIYTVNKPVGIQIVRRYDTQTKESKDIADGGNASWSPNGNWIAFLHCPPSLSGCTYNGIQVSTGEQKLFFKSNGVTALSWSPDSRFVAYISGAGFFERTPSQQFREMVRLRVRRLEDNTEYPFADFFGGDIMWFDWVS